MEIAASAFGACEIGVLMREWLNVGIAEKPGAKSINVAAIPKSSFTVDSLFIDLAMVVHRKVD